MFYMDQGSIDAIQRFMDKMKMGDDVKSVFHYENIEDYAGDPIYDGEVRFLKDTDIETFIKELPKDLTLVGTISTSENESGSEFFMKDVSKGKAVEFLARHYHLTLDDCYGAGDSMNDLSMVHTCTHGIAMDNADDRVKKVAEFVTKSVDDDGLIYALQHYGLIDTL